MVAKNKIKTKTKTLLSIVIVRWVLVKISGMLEKQPRRTLHVPCNLKPNVSDNQPMWVVYLFTSWFHSRMREKRSEGQITVLNRPHTPFFHSANICRLCLEWEKMTRRYTHPLSQYAPCMQSFRKHLCEVQPSSDGMSTAQGGEVRHRGYSQWDRESTVWGHTAGLPGWAQYHMHRCESGHCTLETLVTLRVNSTSIKKREGGNALFLQVSFLQGVSGLMELSHLCVANI